jgi:acetyl esterase
MLLDPALFDPATVDPETRALNADILRKLAGLPDQWSVPPAVVRERRRQGLGPFPLAPVSPRARLVTIEGPRGPIGLRIVAPDAPRGAYLHIHGGGWTLGGADLQDDRLEWLAGRCGLAAVSVEYGLAPEEPYPAGPDDCEAAALWLVRQVRREFGTDRLAIGGESAGANLAVVTLLRLRDRHGLSPYHAANLEAGCYDLAQTPSVRRWGEEKLILNTRDITLFTQGYLRQTGDVRDPDVSPLQADLGGLPPALFSIGTRDPLLDDSLFMASRWRAAGNVADLAVWPGGAHVFTAFPCGLTDKALGRMESFLDAALA